MVGRSKSTFADVRFWLAEHGDGLGLPLGVLGVVIILAPILYLALPRGSADAVRGVVLSFAMVETEEGSYQRASVQLADQQVSVSLPRGHGCRVGSAIELNWSHTLLGRRFTTHGCAAG